MFNTWYNWLYFLLTAAAFIWKGLVLPYPAGTLSREFPYLLLLLASEAGRLFLGTKGNKTESSQETFIFGLLTLLSMPVPLYYLWWQTYVLRLDRILNYILLAFQVVQFILALLTGSKFKTKASAL